MITGIDTKDPHIPEDKLQLKMEGNELVMPVLQWASSLQMNERAVEPLLLYAK